MIRFVEIDQYDDAVEFAVHTKTSNLVSYDRVRGLIFSDNSETMVSGFARFRATGVYVFTFLLLFMGCAAIIPSLQEGTPSLILLFVFFAGLYLLTMWQQFTERDSLINDIGAALESERRSYHEQS